MSLLAKRSENLKEFDGNSNTVKLENTNEFLNDVLHGLSKTPKTLPCKYFYDESGSRLFEEICSTPEYYITRTECEIYKHHGADMAALMGENFSMIEPGAGSIKKVALLLEHVFKPKRFIPLDISSEILIQSSESLKSIFPFLEIMPVVLDFHDRKALKNIFTALRTQKDHKKFVIFFPGSTIGNLDPQKAQLFLKSFADNLHQGDGLLIGVDTIKPHHILEAAYNDTEGKTAQFNMNLIHRIAKELDSDIQPNNFIHQAFWNKDLSRIEMHLSSTVDQTIRVQGEKFFFHKHETIHTENSYKYTISNFQSLTNHAGFESVKSWTDPEHLFCVHYFEKS